MSYLTAETLVLLGVVVLETNLELYGLSEDLGLLALILGLGLDLLLLVFSLLSCGNHSLDCCTQHVARDLAARKFPLTHNSCRFQKHRNKANNKANNSGARTSLWGNVEKEGRRARTQRKPL